MVEAEREEKELYDSGGRQRRERAVITERGLSAFFFEKNRAKN